MRPFSKIIAGLVLIAMVPAPLFAQISQALEWGKKRAVSEAEAVVLRQIGESVGLGSPIFLNQNHAFPAVPDLANFRPTLLKPATLADLNKKLPPGDYSLQVMGYCTRASMHGPGKGLAYKLAPLEGKQAKAVGALLVRGTLRHVSSGELQGTAWNIEAGTPLHNMGDRTRALIHELIPEYESSLEGDFLGNIESTYDKYRLLPNMPTLESLLSKSPEGQYVLTLQRSREVLADKTIAAENIPDRLYQPTGDGLPRILPPATNPQPSPWGEIRPGVFARFTIEQGYAAVNLLEFRIVKSTSQSHPTSLLPGERLQLASFSPQVPIPLPVPAGGLSISGILGFCAATPGICEVAIVGAGVLIAYSILTAAQPLTIVPIIASNGPTPTAGPAVPAVPVTGAGTRTRTCDDNLYKSLKAKQDQECGTPMSCSGPTDVQKKSGTQPNYLYCSDLGPRMLQIEACRNARQDVIDKCFGGEPTGEHGTNVENLDRALAACEEYFKTYCSK